MKTFKIGDRVEVISEPIFVTLYPNDVWEMYPKDEEYLDFGNGIKIQSMFGRANLQHVVGEIGTIEYYRPLLLDPTRDQEGGWYSIKFDNDVPLPKGLFGFRIEEIKLIKDE